MLFKPASLTRPSASQTIGAGQPPSPGAVSANPGLTIQDTAPLSGRLRDQPRGTPEPTRYPGVYDPMDNSVSALPKTAMEPGEPLNQWAAYYFERASAPEPVIGKTAALLPGVQLQPHQRELVDEVKERPDAGIRKLLYHSLGSGKSLSSIAAMETAGSPYTAVVPASLRANFNKELDKFTDRKTPVDVMSYTGVGAGKPITNTASMVFDEAHRLRNPESDLARQAMAQAMRAKNVLLLSGSPIVNQPSDLAPLISILNQKKMSTADFDAKYLDKRQVDPGFVAKMMGVRPGMQTYVKNVDVLKKSLAGKVDYYAPAAQDVRRTEQNFNVNMSPEQAGLYRSFFSDIPYSLRWKLQNQFPMSTNEQKKLMSFMSGPRMVSLSTLPFMRGHEDPSLAYRQSPKLQAAAAQLEALTARDPQAKAVIYSNFLKAGLEPYLAHLKEKNIPAAMFHGGLSDAQRRQIVADYNTGKIRALLLGPSGSEGISLQKTKLLQLLDPHWNEARLQQAIGRGIRFDSHRDLAPADREVLVQRFTSQLPGRWWGTSDERPADTILQDMAAQKELTNEKFRQVLREIGANGGRSSRTTDVRS